MLYMLLLAVGLCSDKSFQNISGSPTISAQKVAAPRKVLVTKEAFDAFSSSHKALVIGGLCRERKFPLAKDFVTKETFESFLPEEKVCVIQGFSRTLFYGSGANPDEYLSYILSFLTESVARSFSSEQKSFVIRTCNGSRIDRNIFVLMATDIFNDLDSEYRAYAIEMLLRHKAIEVVSDLLAEGAFEGLSSRDKVQVIHKLCAGEQGAGEQGAGEQGAMAATLMSKDIFEKLSSNEQVLVIGVLCKGKQIDAALGLITKDAFLKLPPKCQGGVIGILGRVDRFTEASTLIVDFSPKARASLLAHILPVSLIMQLEPLKSRDVFDALTSEQKNEFVSCLCPSYKSPDVLEYFESLTT